MINCTMWCDQTNQDPVTQPEEETTVDNDIFYRCL